jgi:hypothetical protein
VAVYLPSALARVRKSRELWAVARAHGTGADRAPSESRFCCEILELVIAGLMTPGDRALKDAVVQFRESASLSHLRRGRLASVVDELCNFCNAFKSRTGTAL